jgi:hypothetical protein
MYLGLGSGSVDAEVNCIDLISSFQRSEQLYYEDIQDRKKHKYLMIYCDLVIVMI